MPRVVDMRARFAVSARHNRIDRVTESHLIPQLINFDNLRSGRRADPILPAGIAEASRRLERLISTVPRFPGQRLVISKNLDLQDATREWKPVRILARHGSVDTKRRLFGVYACLECWQQFPIVLDVIERSSERHRIRRYGVRRL